MNRVEFYLKREQYEKNLIEGNEDSLQHYGIPKMKWGVRRWQNADGTFNEAGKERYFGKGKGKIGGKARHEGADKNWGNRAEEYTNRLQKAKTYKEIDNIENEILNDKHIKPYYDKVKKIYKKTGDWNKVDEYILNTPIQQEDWIYDMVESHAKKESTADQKIGGVYDRPNTKSGLEQRLAFLKRNEDSLAWDKDLQAKNRMEQWDIEKRLKNGDYDNDQKIGGLFSKKGNDIGTGEHLAEIHKLRREIDEFKSVGLDTNHLEKMLKFYEDQDGYKYGSQPSKEDKKNTIKGIFSKKGNLPDKIREQAKKLREVGEDDLADKYEKHAKEMEQYKKIGHAPGATDQEIKEARRSAANAYATAMRNKWPLFFLFGPIGGAIISSIASNAKINKMIDQLGLDRQDKDKFTASDWDAINEAIKESRRKKPKNKE